jgi:hypothetical protein
MDYRNADPAKAFPMALEAMRNPGLLKTPKYQEQQMRANRLGAHPSINEFSGKLIRRAAALGIPLFPHCMVRRYDEQASAYARGVSKDSPADGFWPHRAYAVDIIHGTLGYLDNPVVPHAWDVIGHLGKEVALSMGILVQWGGDWKFYDPAHWQLEGWKAMCAEQFGAKR